MNAPPVLLYHIVGDVPPFADREEARLFVPVERFRNQMTSLSARAYRTLTLDEYFQRLTAGPLRERAVLLTFDDAYADTFRTVTPILERHGFTAVMFAPYAHLGRPNDWDADHRHLTQLPISTAAQLAAVDRGVWEVASHGFRHVDLCTLGSAERQHQLTMARLGLSLVLGRQVLDLAYPYGAHDKGVREAALASGYRMAFTARGSDGAGDVLQLPRRPVRRGDSEVEFLLKTSPLARPLYRAHRFAATLASQGAK
jgi:peptidoglycan/xylan/chitin deacetylase (PgdA/CDA1 family)